MVTLLSACPLLVLLSQAGTAQAGTAQAGTEQSPPDLVLIMADDLGYGDLSCYHTDNPDWPDAPPATTQTPHIDALAARGRRFLDYHAQPVCSPTRAALMTGRYPQRTGIGGVIYADPKQNRHHGLDPSETTIAEVLRDAGYRTAAIGKWHLGYDVRFNPLAHGFGRFRGYVSGNIDYVSHLDRMGIPDWYDGTQLVPERGYVTDLVTQHALAWLREAGDAPSFLYVAHECPHDPIQAPGDRPVRRSGHVGNTWGHKGPARDEARREMIAAMDRGVGQLVAEIERSGRSTLMIFCSDNGAVRFGDNGPLRGHKGQIYEGGQRVPLIVAAFGPGSDSLVWSDADARGRVIRDLSMTADLLPTLADYANAPLPSDLDGQSLRAAIASPPREASHRTIFQRYRTGSFMRQGRWKYVQPSKGSGELYDLSRDLGETQPVDDPDRAGAMRTRLAEWQQNVMKNATPQPD